MDVFERKQKILELLQRDGRVKVAELSRLFDISEVTIRMDLADLEAKGLLSRVYGGAVSSYKTYTPSGDDYTECYERFRKLEDANV